MWLLIVLCFIIGQSAGKTFNCFNIFGTIFFHNLREEGTERGAKTWEKCWLEIWFQFETCFKRLGRFVFTRKSTKSRIISHLCKGIKCFFPTQKFWDRSSRVLWQFFFVSRSILNWVQVHWKSGKPVSQKSIGKKVEEWRSWEKTQGKHNSLPGIHLKSKGSCRFENFWIKNFELKDSWLRTLSTTRGQCGVLAALRPYFDYIVLKSLIVHFRLPV